MVREVGEILVDLPEHSIDDTGGRSAIKHGPNKVPRRAYMKVIFDDAKEIDRSVWLSVLSGSPTREA